LRCIPNIRICAPLGELELRNIMYTAQLGITFPLAIRYPRGRGVHLKWDLPVEKLEFGKGRCRKTGSDIVAISTGHIGNRVAVAVANCPHTDRSSHYHMAFIKPLDEELLHMIYTTYQRMISIEDGVVTGGLGSALLEFAARNSYCLPF